MLFSCIIEGIQFSYITIQLIMLQVSIVKPINGQRLL